MFTVHLRLEPGGEGGEGVHRATAGSGGQGIQPTKEHH